MFPSHRDMHDTSRAFSYQGFDATGNSSPAIGAALFWRGALILAFLQSVDSTTLHERGELFAQVKSPQAPPTSSFSLDLHVH